MSDKEKGHPFSQPRIFHGNLSDFRCGFRALLQKEKGIVLADFERFHSIFIGIRRAVLI